MHHGVHRGLRDDLGDERVADVGADELGPAHPPQQIPRRWDGVDPEHPLDIGVGGEPGGEMAAEEPADPGDENDGRRH